MNKYFVEHQAEVLREVRNIEVVAGGDARCDSLGHSAKYRTYSIVNTESSQVLEFSLLQVTEIKSSSAVELDGLRHCLDHLEGENVKIAKPASGSHVLRRAHMKKER